MAVARRGDESEFVQRAANRFAGRLRVILDRYQSEGRAVRELLGEPEDFADRALLAQAPLPSPWDELIGPFLRSEGVQARLHISRQAVAAKAARRLLRVFTSDGIALFPVWQFIEGSVMPGLASILALFPEDAGEVETVQPVARSAARSLAA